MADWSDAAQDAHDLREMFERWSFILTPALVFLFVLVALTGALVPNEWGKSVIEKLSQIWPGIVGLIGTMLGGTGLTMARGHADERLKVTQNEPH